MRVIIYHTSLSKLEKGFVSVVQHKTSSLIETNCFEDSASQQQIIQYVKFLRLDVTNRVSMKLKKTRS